MDRLIQWEYNEVVVTDKAMVEDNLTVTILNGYGEHGWEVTGMTRDLGYSKGTLFLMKRDKRWQQDLRQGDKK